LSWYKSQGTTSAREHQTALELEVLRGTEMSENRQDTIDIPEKERDADSLVDMWSSVALVLLAWAVAIFWVSGQ